LQIMQPFIGSRLKSFSEGGTCVSNNFFFAYPESMFILSGFMLLMSFICSYQSQDSVDITASKIGFALGFSWCIQTYLKGRVKYKLKTKIKLQKVSCTSASQCIARLALVGALARAASLPSINPTHHIGLQRSLARHRNHMGFVIPSSIKDPAILQPLRDYCATRSDACNLLEGAFHVIVDSSCTTSATCCKDDFEHLSDLPRPISLQGIGGDLQVAQGGFLRYKCITTRGEIFMIRTFGYYNPHQSFCLFTPKA